MRMYMTFYAEYKLKAIERMRDLAVASSCRMSILTRAFTVCNFFDAIQRSIISRYTSCCSC